MRKLHRIVLSLLILVFIFTAAYADVPNEAWDVLRIVNRHRISEGLECLSVFDSIQNAATTRSEEIIELFSHTRPDGTDCFTVLVDYSIPYSSAGENIAAGQRSASDVMNSWMNSPGHRANILGQSYTHIGIGYTNGGSYSHNWTQLFIGNFSEYIESISLSKEYIDVEVGTSISKMNIKVYESSSIYGKCSLPLIDEMCTGYDKNTVGEQTVTCTHRGQTAVLTVNVLPEKVKSITLSKKTIDVTVKKDQEITRQIQLTAKVLPKSAKQEVKWTSSDETVATVDENGMITVNGFGNCVITASATDRSGITANCKLNIKPKLIKTIKLSGKTKVKVGKQITLKAKIKPAAAYNQTLQWTSSNKKIATVDQNGVVTAKKKGTVTIKCVSTDGSKVKAKLKIKVVK